MPIPCERMQAAWKLGRIGQPAIGALLTILREGSEQAQVLAAAALAGIGEEAVESLIATMLDAPTPVRQKIIWLMWSTGDLRVVEPLIHALEDSDPKTRRYAAWALGENGRYPRHPAVN